MRIHGIFFFLCATFSYAHDNVSNYLQENSYLYFYIEWIFGIIAVVLLLGLYRAYLLKKKNRELESLQEQLMALNNTLESRMSDAKYDLDQAQEVAKIGFWVYDIVEDKLQWSQYSYVMFEVTPSDDENLYDILFAKTHPDDIEKVKNAYYTSVEKRTIYEVEHRLVMDDGSVKYVSERGKTRYSDDGVALITYGTTQDITERVLQDIELSKKDAFLRHQARLAQMGEMLSMIAHQWKQPLSTIASTQIMMRTTIELSKYDLSDEKEREDFLLFLQERMAKTNLYVENLSKTINNFSDFYKPHKLASRSSADKLILKAYELIRDSLASNEIGVSFDLNVIKEISVHENEFMQVILNILQNSKDQLVEKKIENGRINIHSYTEEEYIFIEIEDNAGGIENELIGHIFDPYFSTKLEKNGTGLGLYMCKMIIDEYHGGNISVENSEEGALFTIKIKKLRENES